MNIERMTHAIALLRTIELDRWNYGDWADGYNLVDGKPEVSCGTVACAGGWMALNPICRAQGLMLNEHGLPSFGGEDQTEALAAYLGIDFDDAWSIFIDLSPDPEESRVTPDRVADAMQDLLNEEIAQ